MRLNGKVLSPLMKLIATKRFSLYGPKLKREALASESQLNVGIFAGFPLQHGVRDEAILEEVFILPRRTGARDLIEFFIFKRGSKA